MKTDHISYERYQRQIILKEFGEAGQLKLLQSKVLVVGAGGLGCPALQYLAAAGVGNIGIADDDVISLSNLHRQVLYSTFDIGFSKAEKAKQSLTRLNPGIHITAYNERLTTQNALAIIAPYDIVIDGTDNFASRYLVNDACVLLNKPLVYGAVSQFEGQVAVFNCKNKKGDIPVNYRDLFPQPPKDGEVLNCAESGVLGVLPGIIGTMQANETIKLIIGMGKALINSLLTYNAFNNRVYEVLLTALKETSLLIPATKAAFEQMDYDWLCSSTNRRFEIDGAGFDDLLNLTDVDIIDVREPGELPLPTGFNYTQIPLSQFKEKITTIKSDTVIVFCQSGKRSLQAAQWLFDTFGESKKIFSLQGGIPAWLKQV
ncbi:MAG: HesA/MoeB/ThiF family protein [Ferruginibacter sp.]|nr:HesA/MoeB/ThiF family protein [Ferruginibacter sp.]